MSELLTPRTPGAALRAAREKRRLSIAEVVEATRIKTHIVQALENDDYSVIAAPLYGKGFIKLYAEYVGLDPAPLIRHYLSNYARTVRPTLKTELPPPSPLNDGIPQPSPLARFKESSGPKLTEWGNYMVTTLRDILHALMVAWIRLKARREESVGRPIMSSARGITESVPFPVGKTAALVFAILVVAILVASVFYMYPAAIKQVPATTANQVTVPARRSVYTQALRLAEPPPAPYAKLK
ncbi:MAG: helix-turn-helix transcriptional regulator [bacterium]